MPTKQDGQKNTSESKGLENLKGKRNIIETNLRMLFYKIKVIGRSTSQTEKLPYLKIPAQC